MMHPREFWDLLKVTAREWWEDDTFRYAASLAFYTIFSLAPVLMIAVSLATLFFSREDAVNQITREIDTLIGPQGSAAVRQLTLEFSDAGGGRTAAIIGILTLLIGSTAVFAELQAALNHIWDVKAAPPRRFLLSLILDRVRSFALVLTVGFLLLVSLVISAALAGARDYIGGHFAGLGWVWEVLHLIASFSITTILFALIYRYLPDAEITWRDVTVGAVGTAILFSLGRFLIGMYLGRAAVASAYGAAGSFVVLLIWVYYSALISFFGAEFTAAYARRYGSRIRPEEHAVRVGEKPDRV